MPRGITQCYLPPDRADIPALTPAEAGTRLSDPGGMQGSVDLRSGRAWRKPTQNKRKTAASSVAKRHVTSAALIPAADGMLEQTECRECAGRSQLGVSEARMEGGKVMTPGKSHAGNSGARVEPRYQLWHHAIFVEYTTYQQHCCRCRIHSLLHSVIQQTQDAI